MDSAPAQGGPQGPGADWEDRPWAWQPVALPSQTSGNPFAVLTEPPASPPAAPPAPDAFDVRAASLFLLVRHHRPYGKTEVDEPCPGVRTGS